MAADPILVCQSCYFHEFRKSESRTVCLATPDENNIVTQARLGCPHGIHEHPLPAHDTPPPQLSIPLALPHQLDADHASQFRAVWATIHRRPATLPEDFDRADEIRWLTFLPLPIPRKCGCKTTLETAAMAVKVGAARAWWDWAIKTYPPDLSSRRAYFEWGWRIHFLKCSDLGAPQITLARAARIHGAVDLFDPEEIAANQQATGPIGVAVNATWGLGDAICLTAALRDIRVTYPGEYEFFIKTERPDVFRELPGVRILAEDDAPDIRCMIHGSHPSPDGNGEHIIDFFRRRMAGIIGRPIAAGEKKPWLAKPEEGPPPVDSPYWILAAGWDKHISVKAWPPERWQAAVDALTAKGVKLVRIGAKSSCDFQLPLLGVTLDLVGRTTIAQMFQLIAHQNCIGVICLESSAAHVARAFNKRSVVIAGSRIHSRTVCYGVPEEMWLGDDALPCSGCDAHYSAPRDAKDQRVCIMPAADGFATCMNHIAPGQVLAAVTGDLWVPAPPYAGPLRVGLCSYYTPEIAAWSQPAALRMKEYCDRHGYFYAPFDPAVLPAPDRNCRWQKAAMISPHLPDLDLMAWVDADCVIVRPDFRIESVLAYGEADLYVTRDCNGMNAGVLIWRNTPAAFELLVRWKKAGVGPRGESRNSDQDELGRCIGEMGDKLKVIYLPKPLINAYDTTHAEPGDDQPAWLVHCVSDENKLARIKRWL